MHFLRFLSIAALTTPFAGTAVAQTFTPTLVGDDLAEAFDVVSGDFTGDGIVDIVVTLPDVDDIILLTNPGGVPTGLFAQTTIEDSAEGCQGVEAGDFDGDGDLDIISANTGEDRLRWYENPLFGTNTEWVERSVDNSAEGVLFVELADFDGDGDLDAVASVQADDDVVWYQNPGAATIGTVAVWEEFNIDVGAGEVSGVQVADIDNDGDPDVVANAGGDNQILFYSNPGGALAATDDAFTIFEITDDNADNFFSALGDFDGDGAIDVAVVTAARDLVTIYFNSATAPGTAFQEVVIADGDSAINGVSRIVAEDFDSDGDLDFVVSATDEDNVTFFENLGNATARVGTDVDAGVQPGWSFTTIADELDPNEPRGLVVADFDDDGVQDFALAIDADDQVVVFFNGAGATTSDGVAPPITSFTTAAGGGFEATFDAVAGVVYRIDSSTNLTFPDPSLANGGVGTAMDPATGGSVTVPIALVAGEPRVFFRLVVVDPS